MNNNSQSLDDLSSRLFLLFAPEEVEANTAHHVSEALGELCKEQLRLLWLRQQTGVAQRREQADGTHGSSDVQEEQNEDHDEDGSSQWVRDVHRLVVVDTRDGVDRGRQRRAQTAER